MYRLKTNLQVIGTINGEEIFFCPLYVDNGNIGLTKSGRCFRFDENNRISEFTPHAIKKGVKTTRVDYKVKITITAGQTKMFNIARLMCMTFYCNADGSDLKITGDWTVDHLHIIENGLGSIKSDTSRWRIEDLEVVSAQENRRRFQEQLKLYNEGKLVIG